MTRAGIIVAAGLVVGVVAASMPASVWAGQRHELHRDRRGSDGARHRDRHHDRRHERHHHRHRHHSPRPFVTFYSPPSVVYYTYYTPTPVYYAPPVVYQSPPVYVPAPAMPRVVEYATGRYELRGDGVVTPYEWAWIPNPPPAPSAPVEPPVVKAESTPAVVTPSAPREAYRWTDDHGVTTWTDRLDSIPERYRAQVLRLR